MRAQVMLCLATLLGLPAAAQDAGPSVCRQTAERLRAMYLDESTGLVIGGTDDPRPSRNTWACAKAERRARRLWAATQLRLDGVERACAKLTPEARACLLGLSVRRPGDFDGCREEWRATQDGGLGDVFVFMAECAGPPQPRTSSESLEADRQGSTGGGLSALGEACARRHQGVAASYAQLAAEAEKAASGAPVEVVREACR
ncbi:MAG: hypothetical protein ACOZQL_42845 [Myxococcota bacterium]